MKIKLKVRIDFFSFISQSSRLGDRKSSKVYRAQITELKDEIAELTDKLRLVNEEQKALEDER